jgi:ABC-type nitrate/sulfonate/bicarbonate transport system permease component
VRARLSERPGMTAILLAGLVLAAWEAGSRTGVLSEMAFPAPSSVAAALTRLLSSGALPFHLGATLARLGEGLFIGAIPAALVGLMMGWWRRLGAILDPFIAAFHPLPKIALVPLLMVFFGVGEMPKVAAAAIGAFFPMVLSAVAGVRHINPLLFEVATNYGAGRRKVFSRIVLPGSLPMLLTGLRLSFNVALLITIATELMGSSRGIGALLWLSWQTLRTDDLYAALAVIAAVGVAFNAIVVRLAPRLIPWAAVEND